MLHIAAYCFKFLLRTIETLWDMEKDDTRHVLVIYGIMMGVLAPLAQFLVQQPIGLNGQNAAPCFGYYEFIEGASELVQLNRLKVQVFEFDVLDPVNATLI